MAPEIKELLAKFGGCGDLREGSRATDQYPAPRQSWSDHGIDGDWEDYVEVPVHVLKRMAEALTASLDTACRSSS